MTPDRSHAEYVAMRATIAQRGTARMLLVPAVFIGWAGVAVATAAVITVALSTLVPLLVLAAGFESVFALHLNVERIGRYLQVFHEDERGWEHVAMQFGQKFHGAGTDPLFARLFGIAVSVNYLPAVLGGEVPEMAVLGLLHLVLLNRIRVARRIAGRQREEDLARFKDLAG